MDSIQKIFTTNRFLQIVAVVLVVIAIIYLYKTYVMEKMSDLEFTPLENQPSDAGYFDHPTPEEIEGQYVYPITSSSMITPVDFSHGDGALDPSELLPSPHDNVTSESGAGLMYDAEDLSTKNFLVSGFNIGINSQGNSNKNANRQLRSDPIIPQNLNATPFLQSTLGPDLTRKQFDIGM